MTVRLQNLPLRVETAEKLEPRTRWGCVEETEIKHKRELFN